MSDLKNATDAECREWVELGMEVAQQQNSGDPGCKCATCLVFVSLHDIVMGREAVAAREVKGVATPQPAGGQDDCG